MTITLNNNKKQKLNTLCANLISGVTTIRTISHVLKKITSSFPATKFGWLHYRNPEVFKERALEYHKKNFSAKVCLSEEAKGDLRWWKNNIDEIYNDIIVPNPSIEIKTDASLNCWGAVMGSSLTGGLFSDEETQNHINVLELKAILFRLEFLARHIRLAHIKILCGISTAVACIKNLVLVTLENRTPYPNKFGAGNRKMKIRSQPHAFLEYKTQRGTLNLERMRSTPSGNSGKIYLITYAHN